MYQVTCIFHGQLVAVTTPSADHAAMLVRSISPEYRPRMWLTRKTIVRLVR